MRRPISSEVDQADATTPESSTAQTFEASLSATQQACCSDRVSCARTWLGDRRPAWTAAADASITKLARSGKAVEGVRAVLPKVP